MESFINKLFFYQWQRKLVALLTATVIWVFVNHSIISSKTIPLVPVRVMNLPTDKTILGLLPNGFLSKRTSLTLSGTKNIIDQLEPGDVEIILDVANLPKDGIVQITKKNLVSLNPNINLATHVTSISHPEFVIKMSPILTERIPIMIIPSKEEAPQGYQFLDVWPKQLMQTVTGPQEQVLSLKDQGLEMTLNLHEVSKEQLDKLQGGGVYDDEVNFLIPDQWKKIHIPFCSNEMEFINDPEAKEIHMTFLREQMLPLQNEMPIHVFYSLKYSATINPETYGLATSPFIQFKNHVSILTVPLFVNNVSKFFLEIVKDNLEIDIVTAPTTEREFLEWQLNFIDNANLEDTYVSFLIQQSKTGSPPSTRSREKEEHFRERFRLYLQRFALYLSPQYKLELQCKLEKETIVVHVPNASLAAQDPFVKSFYAR